MVGSVMIVVVGYGVYCIFDYGILLIMVKNYFVIILLKISIK